MSGPLHDVARAYEGVESPDSFPDRAALEAYRAKLLERTAPQADFLQRRLEGGPADAFEVACGNGRLLIELADRQAIAAGYGNDIAASRIAFAREWAAELGLDRLEFAAEDVLARGVPRDGFGLACCITGALGYFEPAGEGLALTVVERLREALRPGGIACVEVYPHPGTRRLLDVTGGEARVWHELPAEDPWRYYLSHYTLEGDVLTHAKTFVHRYDGRIDDDRREALHLYTPESLTALLHAAGLAGVECFEGWSDAPYAGGEILVATARSEA